MATKLCAGRIPASEGQTNWISRRCRLPRLTTTPRPIPIWVSGTQTGCQETWRRRQHRILQKLPCSRKKIFRRPAGWLKLTQAMRSSRKEKKPTKLDSRLPLRPHSSAHLLNTKGTDYLTVFFKSNSKAQHFLIPTVWKGVPWQEKVLHLQCPHAQQNWTWPSCQTCCPNGGRNAASMYNYLSICGCETERKKNYAHTDSHL